MATKLTQERMATSSVRRAKGLRLSFLPAAVLVLCALPAQTFAQNTGTLDEAPTIDRGRVDRVEPELQLPPRPTTGPKPSVEVDAGATSGAATQAPLTAIRYEGSTLSPALLNEATAALVGKPLTKPTLQAVANAISAVYTQSNVAFFSVKIPPQVAKGGVLTVQIIEGRISEYRLVDETPSTPTRLIDAHLKRLMAEQPTQKPTLERTLSLLRDIPGQTVDAQLRATGRTGELALDLTVKRKQLELTLNINNRGVTNVVDGVQMQVAAQVNGVVREGDSTRFSSYVPFTPSRYQFYTLSHSTPLGANGTTLTASGAYVRTRTRPNDILGEAKQAGLTITHPVIRSYKRNLSVSLGLDGINSNNYYLDQGFGGFKTRTARLGANWSDVSDTGGYALSATFSQGLNALGAEPLTGYSEASFRKANLQLTAVKSLGDRFSLKATGQAQYSDDRLPTTERFALGGNGAGLAFRNGTLTAESAVAGSLEASWKAGGKTSILQGLTLFAYVDGALAHSVERPVFAIPAEDYSLASAGGGIRVGPVKKWVASVQVATPIKRPFDFYSKKPRVFFSITRTI